MVEAKARQCVTGADPTKRFPVPMESQFDGFEFKDAPEIGEVAEVLIASAHELGDLEAYPPMIRYMWRAKAKKSKGATMFGNCAKVAGLAKYFGRTEWVLEIAADLLRDMKATNFQVEALLFHELKHIKVTVDDDGNPTYAYVREEYSAFADEIKRYGAWHSEIEHVADSFAQAPLFQEVDRSTGELRNHRSDKATVSYNGKTVDLDDRAAAAALVGEAIDATLTRARNHAPKISNVTAEQADALLAAGAQ